MDENFYDRLKSQLDTAHQWPANYMYKFILPNSDDKKKSLESIFDGANAKIETNTSAKSTYVSYSINVLLSSPDEVISYYKKVGEIEGVISM